MWRDLATCDGFEKHQSLFDAAGACAAGAAGVAGAIWTGAAGARFGVACFLAAASAGEAAGAGRAAGGGAVAAAGFGANDAGPGSGVMMFTGGVDAALGKSALVGRPVGIDGGSPATSPAPGAAAMGAGGGAFHDDA
jgi:pilus assembly protein FimV